MIGRPRRQQDQRGIVLFTVLVFILLSTLAASSLVVVHTTQMQRDKEEQLLFAGDAIRRAIASYYNTLPPGGARSMPPSLEALLADQRFPKPVHHLRRLYTDPMTGRADWQVVRDARGIVGVRSQSDQSPVKKKGFANGYEHFEDRERYSDWIFSIN